MNHSETFNLESWQHSHDFSHNNLKGEKRIRYVLTLTTATILVQILAGVLVMLTGSAIPDLVIGLVIVAFI
ncbi:hypothetical protein [Marinicella rhabdoformis]|uniref:hypothetical protein n=1 Tax=Marinicella rhabdoformis TaxID=2580566 RepID=UPI0012AEBAA3|nr:hypothetical protein [Marinicella rhabdoformis]